MLVVLASASPRRREILEGLGVAFEVVIPDVDEVGEGEPEQAVTGNALRKARAGREARPEADLVLGVDTDVILDGVILGKAGDEGEARERLEMLSGRTHEVLSGVAVLAAPEVGRVRTTGTNGKEGGARVGIARSLVTFRDLEPATLDLYLRSGEWRDRAGAYAIQGLGSILIERLEGDLSNVIGLPIPTLLELAPELSP